MEFPTPVLAAVVWCRRGACTAAGRDWFHPIGMFGDDLGATAFAMAERFGLLAHDPIWRATPLGERVLRQHGLLDAEPCPAGDAIGFLRRMRLQGLAS